MKASLTIVQKKNENTIFVSKNNNNNNNNVNIILDHSTELLNKNNETYYNDILKCINMLYSTNSKSILKIKISKITMSEEMLKLYNKIIKKYELNKELFDIDNFDFEYLYDHSDILSIAKTITNNLLIKINYIMNEIIISGKKKYIIKML
jgi:hypothetical protein